MSTFDTPSPKAVVQDLLNTAARQRGRSVSFVDDSHFGEEGFTVELSPGEGVTIVTSEELDNVEPNELVEMKLAQCGL
jgi:hypothetical protein